MKLKLKTIDGGEILTRDQLKGIFGGDMGSGGYASCSVTCKDDAKTVIKHDCGYGHSCGTDETKIYCDGVEVEKCPT